ncbi:MAG: hypothetical protein IPH82_29450 [Chloroflexi bacterium]|nr:hypothetical protein [Chloroflexota bacterium]
MSGWIEQNRAPVTEFFNETIGETGEKLRDLGGQIVTFVSVSFQGVRLGGR